MKAQEFRQQLGKSMTERQLQEHVVALAKQLGWMVYHTYDSRRSQPGFPDLVLVRGVVLYRELKAVNGVLSPEQKAWLQCLRVAGADAGVWRPWHLLDGTVERALRGR